MIRAWLIAAALGGVLSVAAGAAAAHLPAGERGAELLRTGALYGMVHGAALIAVTAMARSRDRLGLPLTIAGWGFAAGCWCSASAFLRWRLADANASV